MQYLLTKEEYDKLHEEVTIRFKVKTEELQKICTQVADNMPIKVSWMKDTEPSPWGCILSSEHEHCCDECPVQKICPHPSKNWSQ